MRIDEIIYKTLIAGDSYRTLLKGLWVTLQISLLSLLLGTLLGVAVCAMRRSRLRLIHSIAAVYMAVVRGSPVLLLLNIEISVAADRQMTCSLLLAPKWRSARRCPRA